MFMYLTLTDSTYRLRSATWN